MSQQNKATPYQQFYKEQTIFNQFQAGKDIKAPNTLQQKYIYPAYVKYPPHSITTNNNIQQGFNYKPNVINYPPYQVQNIPYQQKINPPITAPQQKQNYQIYNPKNVQLINPNSNLFLQPVNIQNNNLIYQQNINNKINIPYDKKDSHFINQPIYDYKPTIKIRNEKNYDNIITIIFFDYREIHTLFFQILL